MMGGGGGGGAILFSQVGGWYIGDRFQARVNWSKA
jgi:hypothetical protein